MTGAGRHYTVEELGEGVHAAIHRPGGFAICNSGIVGLNGGGLVFDTGLTIPSSQELRVLAERSLGRSPSLVANSHWHLDHSLGNQEFARLPIWGTRRTREVQLEMRDELSAELQRSSLEKTLLSLEARRESMSPGPPMEDLEFNILIHQALLSSAGRQELHPPSQTFETQLSLPGRKGAQLISFGSGHTEADAILHLSEEKLVFAGDLVCLGIEPSMGSGDPVHWLEVLERIEGLGAERIVPGHGPISAPERIQETRDYVSGVLEAARSPRGSPLPPSIRRWEGSVSLEYNLSFAREWVATHERAD